ncbi:gamma-glutamylcyclotransferase family protein [Natronolimnohabitans sp. A-GB9]|uniref:gamma-glutamylcyclotransferase family protein n=1 Tax=Natronolimnohabitans sp. A-GB9 TaxID=3069757 RepID=UPI0027B87277|nr:gamma-glutamylcyclotransferase family protein [Natronolimnohabitans sp. A-GB9]MDQ2050653.1 gamma-glutamylcyclotransferase family protein [Natronolimnohabitans sp. A-GB9]
MQLFVYGTLTDPAQIEAIVDAGPGTFEFVGPTTLEGFRRVDGRYPTLVPGGSVEGRLLAVDKRALERLDRYEGVDQGLYVRIAVPKADGGQGWVYVGHPDRLGADADAAWPDERSFREAVETAAARRDAVLRVHE